MENSRRSGFTHRALLYIEYCIMVLVLTSLMGSALEQDIDAQVRPLLIKSLLVGQSLITLILSKNDSKYS